MKNQIFLALIAIIAVVSCKNKATENQAESKATPVKDSTITVLDTLISDMGVTQVNRIDSVTLNVKTNKPTMANLRMTDLLSKTNNTVYRIDNTSQDSVYLYNFIAGGKLEVTVYKNDAAYNNKKSVYKAVLLKATDSAGIEYNSTSSNTVYLVTLLNLIKTNGNLYRPVSNVGTENGYSKCFRTGCKNKFSCYDALAAQAKKQCPSGKMQERRGHMIPNPVDASWVGCMFYECKSN
jgi:hypothetical protein